MTEKRDRAHWRYLPQDVSVDFSKVKFDQLTIGELETFEDIAGPEAVERAFAGHVGVKAMVALAFLALRKDYPELTIAEVRERKIDILKSDSETPAEDEVPNSEGVSA